MALEPIRTPQHDPDAHTEQIPIEPLCAVFRRALRDEGLKYTPERAAILDTIIEIDGLFEADHLLEKLRSRSHSVSKATVYRTLKLLELAGIIQHVLFDREQSHYELAMGKRGSTLLIDVDSGEIITEDVPELIELRDAICKRRGVVPQGHKLQIFVKRDA